MLYTDGIDSSQTVRLQGSPTCPLNLRSVGLLTLRDLESVFNTCLVTGWGLLRCVEVAEMGSHRLYSIWARILCTGLPLFPTYVDLVPFVFLPLFVTAWTHMTARSG